ncbi:MAG: flagellar hook basal-body protein [Nitrospirae bacterium]|nr:flagellar hook basal-body protein [Nitrospirota bacterium]
MRRAEFALVSGAQGQEQMIDVLSNNLANVNTPGFRKDRVTFRTYLPHREYLHRTPPDRPGIRMTPFGTFPTPWGMAGSDVPHAGVDRIYVRYEEGEFQKTGNPLDVALSGKGFLTVRTPGGTLLTRNGHLTLDVHGHLVTHEGHQVLDATGKPILLSAESREKIHIDGAGKIYSGERQVAQLGISEPTTGEDSLVKVGDGLFYSPGGIRKGEARVMAGGVEGSNVKGASEMVRMIEGMRTYQTDLQALHTLNDLTNRTVNDMTVIA